MFFKVLAVTLITICAADNKKFLTELEQDLPALKLNRYILFPKIYKYSKVDQSGSTLRSLLRHVRAAATNLFQNIQYAPLHDEVNQRSKKADEEHTNMTPTPTSAPTKLTNLSLDKKIRHLHAKYHLEPHTEATDDAKCYAPGFDFKTSVSRSPGHNAIYRIIPELTKLENPVKNSDYVKPIGINLKLEILPTTIKPSLDFASEHVDRPLTLSDEHFVINPDIIETVLQDKSKRYTPLSKYHRLHLNIARVYSPGQVPPKSAVFPKIHPEHYGRRQARPHVHPPHSNSDMKMNTMLYPVKRYRKGYRFRTSIIHL